MATTEFGVNHSLSVKLWSEKLFREALKEAWVGRFIGKGSSALVQMLTETSKGAGDRIRVGLRMQLSGAGQSGDSTLEGLEEAMSFYSDDVTINQLRNAVRSAGRASEQRVPYSMREEARMGLTDWLAGRMDESFFNQVCGNTGQADTRYTGMQATVAPTAAASAGDGISRIIVGGGQAAEGSLSATTTHAIDLRDIDAAVARAKNMSPVMRPVRVGGKDMFVAFLHPYQVYQLRGQTSTAEWADIQKAAMMGGQISDNPLVTGAVGIYNNTIIHEATRVPNTTGMADNSAYRRGVFCGAQAAAIAFGQNNSQNRMTWNEELFDYGNQLGVAAGLIWGLKKLQFNSTDFGAIALAGYAPAP
jgi:N4-gp56 family major capsid protein